MDKSTRAICFVRGQEFLGWFKSSGEQITGTSPSDRIIVEHEDDSHSLVIRRLMLSDGGEYICRGSKTSATYSLYVECTYRILNPIISARLIYVESAISVSLFRDLKWGRGKGIIRKAFCAGLYLGSLSLVWRFSWAYIKIPHGNWPFKKLQRTNKRNEIHTRTASRNWTNCPSKKCSLWKTSHRFCESTKEIFNFDFVSDYVSPPLSLPVFGTSSPVPVYIEEHFMMNKVIFKSRKAKVY